MNKKLDVQIDQLTEYSMDEDEVPEIGPNLKKQVTKKIMSDMVDPNVPNDGATNFEIKSQDGQSPSVKGTAQGQNGEVIEPKGIVEILPFDPDSTEVKMTKVQKKDGTTGYFYKGPLTTNISYLLEDLELMNKTYFGRCKKLKEANQRLDDRIDKHNPCKNYTQGPCAINKESIVVMIVFYTVAIYYAVAISNIPKEGKGEYVQAAITYSPLFSILFVTFGLIYLSVNLDWAVKLFLIGFPVPMFLILYDINRIFPRDPEPSINPVSLVVKVFLLFNFLSWGAIYPFNAIIKASAGRFFACLFVLLVFCGFYIVTIFEPAFEMAETDSFDTIYIQSNAAGFAVVLMSLSIGMWLSLHNKYFRVPNKVMEKIIIKEGKKVLEKPVEMRPEFKPGQETKLKRCWMKFFKHLWWISSLTVGGCFMIIEMFLAYEFVSSFADWNQAGMAISGFFITILPIFLLLGMPLALTRRIRARNKMLIFPIIFSGAMFGLVPLASVASQDEELGQFSWYLITIPPTMIFYWLGMAFIGLHRRRYFYFILMFTTIFYWIPIFVFRGFAQSEYFGSVGDASETLFIVFIVIGTFSVALYFGWSFFSLFYYFIRGKLETLKIFLKKRKIYKLRMKMKKSNNKINVLKKAQTKALDGPKNKGKEPSSLVKSLNIDDKDSDDDDNQMDDMELDRIIKQRRNAQKKLTVLRQTKVGSKVELNEKTTFENQYQQQLDAYDSLIKANEEQRKLEVMQDKIKKKLERIEDIFRKKLFDVIHQNYKTFGYWINASCFIISYTVVAYVVVFQPSTASDSQKGMLYGAAGLVPIIFFSFNWIIRLKSARIIPNEMGQFNHRLLISIEGENIDFNRMKRAKKLQILVLVLAILVNPVACGILLAIFSTRVGQIALITILVVNLILGFLLYGLLSIKRKYGPYQKFFVPTITATLWLFVILPFLVMIPLVSSMIDNESDDYAVFIKTTFILSAVILMVFVTSFAIIANIMMQRIEYEKRVKFIIKYMKRMLRENAVKTEDAPIRRLYDEYCRKVDKEPLKRMLLKERRPILQCKITEDKLYYYSHRLLTYENYLALKKKLAKKKAKDENQKKKKSIFRVLCCCCYAAEEEEGAVDLDENKIELEEKKRRSHFAIDEYMPEDLSDYDFNKFIREVDYNKLFGIPKEETKKSEESDDEEHIKAMNQISLDKTDAMTPILRGLKLANIQKNDRRYENVSEHARNLLHDQSELEKWYQHVFDYISGRVGLIDLSNDSQGLIYQNCLQFLRLSTLDEKLDEEVVEEKFSIFSADSKQKYLFLKYEGFIQFLKVLSQSTFQLDGWLLLKKLTKYIYPAIMMNCPDIQKHYTAHMSRIVKREYTHEPCIGKIFGTKPDEENIIILPSQSKKSEFEIMPFTQDEKMFNFDEEGITSQPRQQVEREEEGDAEEKQQMSPNNPAKLPLDGISKSQTNTSNFSKNTPKFKRSKSRKKITQILEKKPNEEPITPKESKEGSNFEQKNKKSFGQKLYAYTIGGCCRCLHWCYYDMASQLEDWVEKQTKRLGKALGMKVEESDEEEQELEKKKIRRQAPSWPILVERMMKEIPKAEKLYEETESKKGLEFTFNLTNVSAMFGKVTEVYGYMSYAFRPEVPWFSNPTYNDIALAVNGEASFYSSFKFLFYLAFGLICVYSIVCIPGIISLKKGTLGRDKHGKEAKFPTRQFFLVFALTTLGGSLFPQIMKFILDGYVCQYRTRPWQVLRDTSIECLSDEHFIFLGLGAVGLLIYYPLSTLMYPNFQFNNEGLDLKYIPSWIVLLVQGKLIITGLISFYKPYDETDTAAITTQLTGTVIVLLLLALICSYWNPCLIKRFNVYDVGSYFIAAIVNATGIFVFKTGNSTAGLIIIGIVIPVGFYLTFYIARVIYPSKHKNQKKNADAKELIVNFDPAKRKPENKDLNKARKEAEEEQEKQKEKDQERKRGYNYDEMFDFDKSPQGSNPIQSELAAPKRMSMLSDNSEDRLLSEVHSKRLIKSQFKVLELGSPKHMDLSMLSGNSRKKSDIRDPELEEDIPMSKLGSKKSDTKILLNNNSRRMSQFGHAESEGNKTPINGGEENFTSQEKGPSGLRIHPGLVKSEENMNDKAIDEIKEEESEEGKATNRSAIHLGSENQKKRLDLQTKKYFF